MKALTKEGAEKLLCPYKLTRGDGRLCVTDSCMSWLFIQFDVDGFVNTYISQPAPQGAAPYKGICELINKGGK